METICSTATIEGRRWWQKRIKKCIEGEGREKQPINSDAIIIRREEYKLKELEIQTKTST
jgi:hypothetical protein